MGIFMLLGLLIVVAALAGAVFLGVRFGLGGTSRRGEDAHAILERRLAAGEISSEDYHDRAAALRSLQPSVRRRR